MRGVCGPTCVCADVLDVVALSVREVGTLRAGVEFTGEMIPQVFPPVILTHCCVRTQRALEDSADRGRQKQVNFSVTQWFTNCKCSILYQTKITFHYTYKYLSVP